VCGFLEPANGLITSGSKLSVNIATIVLLPLLLQLSCKKNFESCVKMSGTSIYVAFCQHFVVFARDAKAPKKTPFKRLKLNLVYLIYLYH